MKEFREGWTVVLAAAIGAGLGASAVPYYTIGVFSGALTSAFDWSRGEVFLAIACMLAGSLIATPLVGYLSDRHGVRPVALVSIILFSGAVMSLSLTPDNLLIFYAQWLLMACAGTGTLALTWTKAINGWFDERRGLALGLALAGSGVSAAILPLYATWLIDEFGWRIAYVALGATPLAIALPFVYFFLFERKQAPTTPGNRSLGYTGVSVAEAIRDYRFWVTALGFTLVSFSVSGIIANLVPMLIDVGFDGGTAARIFGSLGLAVVGGRVIGGWLIDRFWAPAIAFVFLSLPALSCLILLAETLATAPNIVAIVILGFAAGAEFDLAAFFVSRYFGLRNYGKVYGLQYLFFALGGGIGPAAYGAVFDRTGSYEFALTLGIGLFCIGGALFLTLGRYPSFPSANAH
jgi:MFS family permease